MALIAVSKNGRDVGECIYSGFRDPPLQREHTIQLGLGERQALTKIKERSHDCESIA